MTTFNPHALVGGFCPQPILKNKLYTTSLKKQLVKPVTQPKFARQISVYNYNHVVYKMTYKGKIIATIVPGGFRKVVVAGRSDKYELQTADKRAILQVNLNGPNFIMALTKKSVVAFDPNVRVEIDAHKFDFNLSTLKNKPFVFHKIGYNSTVDIIL